MGPACSLEREVADRQQRGDVEPVVLVDHRVDVLGHVPQVGHDAGFVERGQVDVSQLAVATQRLGLPLLVPVVQVARPPAGGEALVGQRGSPPDLGADELVGGRPVRAGHVERLRLVVHEPVDDGERQPIEQEPVPAEGLGEPSVERIGEQLLHGPAHRRRCMCLVLLPRSRIGCVPGDGHGFPPARLAP